MKKELIYNIGDESIAEQIMCLLRKAFYRMATRYAVIGVDFNGLGCYDIIPSSTSTVLDAIVPFSTIETAVDQDLLLADPAVRMYEDSGMSIYEVKYSFNQKHITLKDFAPYIVCEENHKIVDLIDAQQLDIRLYIMEVDRIMPDALCEAAMEGIPDSFRIVPLPAKNHYGDFKFRIDGSPNKKRLYVTITAPTESGIKSVLSNFEILRSMLVPIE